MTEDVRIETTGETVGEAKWTALRELEKLVPDLDRSAVQFQVLAEGERGLLGVGYEPARVVALVSTVVTADREPRPDESERGARVRELLEHIAAGIGVACRIEIDEDDEEVRATLAGRELGMLIGRHGQTIDAIQYLLNAILARAGEERKPIVVDAAGYRDRRQAVLDALAIRSAERAIETGGRVELEPMTAVERKVVHVRLQDYPGVTTTSEGTEPNRFVVVLPA
jgi:spoIIIJ-associated protein